MSDTTIPADAIPGLLVGWTGPVDMLGLRLALPDEWVTTAYGNGGMANGADPKRLRLNCLRPEVQDHIGRVLAAGVRCAACGGRGSVRASVQPGCDGECPEPCGCDAGYLRKPAPIHHILDSARTNALSPQHIAEAVAWSVRSVARGGEVLVDVAREWESAHGGKYEYSWKGWRRVLVAGYQQAIVRDEMFGRPTMPAGWSFGNRRGPETGPEGREKADAACLAANIGFIDGGALVLPGGES